MLNSILPSMIDANSLLIPADADKDRLSRLKRYTEWLNDNGHIWYNLPDLNLYCEYLLKEGRSDGNGGLSPSSVNVHLSTIRSRYRELLTDNRIWDAIEASLRAEAASMNISLSLADVNSSVDRLYRRINNAVIESGARADEIEEQDVSDLKHVRLTSEQASFMLSLPGVKDNRGKRDTALLGLMLTTGIRAAEAAALQVPDLRQVFGGELALHVRKGKGSKARMVPFGAMDWVLDP